MSTKKLKEALDNPERRARKSVGVLAKLFWQVVAQYTIRYPNWKRTLRSYVLDPQNVVKQTVERRNEARSNLTSALTADKELTFTQLIRGIKAIDGRKYRITLEVWKGDSMTYSKVVHEEEYHPTAANKESKPDGETND